MPTTIYDSSQITKRRLEKAISGSFISRIQNPTNPNTGYAPMLGISQQSIINAVKTGQMTEYRKNDSGCTNVSVGCPCNVPINRLLPNISCTQPNVFPGNNQLAFFLPDICVTLGEDSSPILYYLITTIIGGETKTIQTFYPQTIDTNGGLLTYLGITAFNKYGASNILEDFGQFQYTTTDFPKAPTISITDITSDSVTIEVTANADTGTAPLDDWQYFFFNTEYGLVRIYTDAIGYTSTPQSIVIPSLTANTKYAIGFRARNTATYPEFGKGRSSLSNIVEFTTLP
jgi:hypothetical protein